MIPANNATTSPRAQIIGDDRLAGNIVRDEVEPS